ncbi:Y-box-binding protein 1-like [Rhopalosiphum padi]|uniref:Y-box-binding protein 1-like n=1 Tax=Rhopalosiphum padi TaxID=40932 RepID=UPI00298DF59A|nr:Y-box-binding protein 1-like [Rhopalosiphum padi]
MTLRTVTRASADRRSYLCLLRVVRCRWRSAPSARRGGPVATADRHPAISGVQRREGERQAEDCVGVIFFHLSSGLLRFNNKMAEQVSEKRNRRPPKKPVAQKPVICMKVTGVVKRFHIKPGYGFIIRNDTKENVFVHQSAIIKNNPNKIVRSLAIGETVEFDVKQSKKGYEAANVTGPNGDAVKGSPYAADKKKNNYGQWSYGRRPNTLPRYGGQPSRNSSPSGDKDETINEVGEQQRHYRQPYQPNWYNSYCGHQRGPPLNRGEGGDYNSGDNYGYDSSPSGRGRCRGMGAPRRFFRQGSGFGGIHGTGGPPRTSV